MSLPKLLLPIVVVVALIIGWNWWTADAQRIRRQLEALNEEVEKSPGEGQLATAFKAEQATRFFAEPFQFRARQFDFETDNRAALARGVVAYRVRSERIAPSVLHSELEVDEIGRTAKMVVVIRFGGGFSGRANEAYRFQLNWIEQESEWKIGFADLIEIVPASVL